MSYLQRINYRPNMDGLAQSEQDSLRGKFDPGSVDVIINGDTIRWDYIEEIEVAMAARQTGLAGWIVKNMVMKGDRYHVAFYFGREEAVLINLTLPAAQYVVNTAAYYLSKRVTYTGPDGIAATSEV
ncbi:MAG: hypothetical protein MUF38_12470 [Anaerolineae bacterium]|jgi:hypothetical protein|nr:hypothetical protein [Anaerolineae bacterium]